MPWEQPLEGSFVGGTNGRNLSRGHENQGKRSAREMQGIFAGGIVSIVFGMNGMEWNSIEFNSMFHADQGADTRKYDAQGSTECDIYSTSTKPGDGNCEVRYLLGSRFSLFG